MCGQGGRCSQQSAIQPSWLLSGIACEGRFQKCSHLVMLNSIASRQIHVIAEILVAPTQRCMHCYDNYR
jgi:hypothetical protein